MPHMDQSASEDPTLGIFPSTKNRNTQRELTRWVIFIGFPAGKHHADGTVMPMISLNMLSILVSIAALLEDPVKRLAAARSASATK